MRPKYKTKYLRQRKITKHFLIVLLLSLLAITYLLYERNNADLITPLADTPTPVIRTVSKTREPLPQRWEGLASYYSWDGCIGCNAERIMANGDVLDDTKPTIAFHHLPLNTWVIVTNLDNNMFIRAKVTDHGGFERLYGRIADINIKVKI